MMETCLVQNVIMVTVLQKIIVLIAIPILTTCRDVR